MLSPIINQGGLFPIVRGLRKLCWFLFKWGLLAAVVGVAVAIPYLYRQLDSEVRRRIEAKVAQHYPHLKVAVRSAEVVKGEGIQVRGLSIVDPAGQGPRAELLHLEEVFLTCCADLDQLIAREPEVTRIRVRRPTLRVTRQPDGSWSAAQLLPLPKFGPRPPEMIVENGAIEVFDASKTPSSTLTLRDVNLRLSSVKAADVGGGAALGGPLGSPALPVPPTTAPDARRLQASLSGDLFERVEVEGLVDLARSWCELGGTVKGLHVSPELRHALPADLATRLAPLGPLRGLVTLDFRATYEPDSEPAMRFDVWGELTGGRWDDGRLPHPLTDVYGKFRATNDGLAVDRLFARSGQSTLRVSGRRDGYEERSPLALRAEIRQLDLDPQLNEVLPDVLRAQWSKYSPAGQVHINATLDYDGRDWRAEASVECLKVSFSYYKYPYRLEHAKGSVELKDDVLRVNLLGYSGSQPVRVTAEGYSPLTRPYGWLEAKGENLPLDEKLFAAIPEPSRSVVRSLDPRGTLGVSLRVWRERPEEPLHRHLVVGLNRCFAQYQKFPYPMNNVRGTLEMLDGVWSFRDLEATNETGFITCEGRLVPTAEAGRSELFLKFRGTNVPLNEPLRDALRLDIQRLWAAMRPQGSVDLDVEVRYLTGEPSMDVLLRAEPRGTSTSIEPVHFPYRLERLSGAMYYRAGRAVLERMRAEHGNVKLAAAGECAIRPDGSWALRLEGLSVDRLRLDRDLIHALPERLKKTLVALQPTQPVNLSGTLELARGGNQVDPLTARWDLDVHLAKQSLDCGIRLENLNGGVRLAGQFDGQHVGCRGELSLDSLHWKNFQFTQVLGPLWIDDDQVLFGTWVDRPRQGEAPAPDATPRPRPLTAQLLGGTVSADAWLSLDGEPRYGLEATLVHADLARFAKENLGDGQDLRGRIAATVSLRGAGRSLNGLGGRGTIQLRDADIYELPLMIRLLKLLSIRQPDPTAFSTADIDYRIQGAHVYFDRIDFNGDAISLLGQGAMDFQTAIQLAFHAQVGHGRIQIPLLQEVLGGASKQILLIYVNGTLQDPLVTKQAFPGVNHALQQFQDELEKSASQRLLPPLRPWNFNVERRVPGRW